MNDPVLRDAADRWQRGRETHGKGEWVGRPPLEECYEELLDTINYLQEHIRQCPEDRQWAVNVIQFTLADARVVRTRILERNPKWNLNG